ncbi:putative glutamyl-trna amidotransferase subunit a protein [Eutypa lata UCREL1]|uniref:Putative glutamyl-trna amidotransferase subunit a protein n=1 Tax=Eutypa lata (strain UCR-EL1) TaxID=1287681 RepID=M7TBP8_EUTLA|nr:putative glutamyl-trna amidotransferase subunit a protein [Eutypa lata UCREL1]
MIFETLFSALVIGCAGSGLYLNQECGKREYCQASEYLATNPLEAKPLPSLYKADIDTLAEGLDRKEFTSAYVARINEVNDALSVVTEINPDALSIASALDNERSRGAVLTAGQLMVDKPTDPSILTKIPRVVQAVVRWQLPTVCLGGETAGSIIDPASYNNIVGMKPRLTSRHLVIPISEHMDTVGPMTKTVKDSAYVLQSIAGVDPFDNYTSAIPSQADLDFVNACKVSALAGARVGVPRNVISLMSNNNTESMVKAFDEFLDVLRSAGALVIENTNFPAAQDFIDNSLLSAQIMGADFIVDVERYLDQLVYNPHNITNLVDLRRWTQSSPLEGYPGKPTELWDAALQNWNNTEYGFWRAYQQGLYYGNEGGLLGAIKQHNLDAVVLPSHFAWDWAAVVGAPIVSVPIGAMPLDQPIVSDADGLVSAAPNIPFGFSFLGARFTDAKLIGLAYAFEQRTMIRRTVHPYIAPQTDLRNVVGKQYK